MPVSLSARSMVACFCVVIVATSPILLSLLSQATDEAVKDLVPPWHRSVTQTAAERADKRTDIAAQLLNAAYGRIISDAMISRVPPEVCAGVITQSRTQSKTLDPGENSGADNSEENFPDCESYCEAVQVTLADTAAAIEDLLGVQNITFSLLVASPSSFVQDFTRMVPLCGRMVPRRMEQVRVVNETNSVTSSRLINEMLLPRLDLWDSIFESSSRSASHGATTVVSPLQHVHMLASQDNEFEEGQVDAFRTFAKTATLAVRETLPNRQFPIYLFAHESNEEGEPNVPTNLVEPLCSSLSPTLLDAEYSSIPTLPDFAAFVEMRRFESSIFDVKQLRPSAPRRFTYPPNGELFVQSCCRANGGSGELHPLQKVCTDQLQNEVLDAAGIREALSVSAASSAINGTYFDLMSNFFVTRSRGLRPDFASGGPTRFVLLIATKREAVEGISGPEAVSVIVGVTMSAMTIILVLTLLHYVFHPLKIVGSILRDCADIRLLTLEKQRPSVIVEIFAIQKHVDDLVGCMLRYGRYMPDKTQLHNLLESEGDLRDFDETEVAVDLKQQHIFGAVPHSITVDVEYRSRANPSVRRSVEDMRKNCQFEFLYTGGDDVQGMLLDQCRVRLGERIGEPLQMRWKDPSLGNSVDMEDCQRLNNTEEVLYAIEHSKKHHLSLIVVKTSVKNYFPQLTTLFSVALAGVCALLGSTWLRDPDFEVRRAGGAVSLSVGAKLIINLSASLYLVKKFTVLHPPFAQWVPEALQELIVSCLAGAFSVVNVKVLFTHTRITPKIRFNAPHTDNFDRLIIKYAIAGHTIGDLAPLGVVVFMLATNNGKVSLLAIVVIACLLVSLGLFCFQSAIEHVFDKSGNRRSSTKVVPSWLEAKLQEGDTEELMDLNFTTRQVGDGGSSTNDGADNSTADGSDAGDAPILADEDWLEIMHKDDLLQELDSADLHLGLCRRDATVMHIALRRSEKHFDFMDTVEIQLLCNKFFGCAFNEVKLHGGMILSVRGGEITIGFNCHRLLEDHPWIAIQCFYSIQAGIQEQVKRWSVDDRTVPRLVGAIMTSEVCTVGYVGTEEARSFQIVGRTADVVEAAARVGHHYGARLVCTTEVARRVDVSAKAARAARNLQQRGRKPRYDQQQHHDPDSLNLETVQFREIDHIVLRQGARYYQSLFGEAFDHLSRPLDIHVFEVLPHGMKKDELVACRSAIQLLKDVSTTKQGEEMVHQYCDIYPDDEVMGAISMWAGKAVMPREATALGLDAYQGEMDVDDLLAGKVSIVENTERVARQHPLLRQVMGKKDFHLFFTDSTTTI